jgi:hypothetical protein
MNMWVKDSDKKMILIVPTRHRPESVARLLEAFQKTAKVSDILFGVDFDDASEYTVSEQFIERGPRLKMNGTLNALANKYKDDYEFIGFMGDDHLPQTEGWDEELIREIGNRPGFAYGNDLFQGARLPTAVVMSSSIVKAIGYMAPPVLVHLYLDNFWMDMGRRISNLRYREDVIIEHLHYLNGKSEKDAGYAEVNSPEIGSADRDAYVRYCRSGEFEEAALKILES